MVGLDLTYEVYGHLVRDGRLVGLVLEPAMGRLVEFRDRAKASGIPPKMGWS